MSPFKVFPIVAFGLIVLTTAQVAADCSRCSTLNYAACINTTSFAVCYDGATPSSQIVTCPEGKICTTQPGICKDPDPNVIPGCAIASPKCNECSGTFACLSKTDFAYCDTNGLVLSITSSCLAGKYCSIDNFLQNGDICAPSCVTEPTCSNDLPVIPPTPVPNWKESCDFATNAGGYPNKYDSTCKTYVYCEMYNNEMDAVLFTCSTGYFNKATSKCETVKPSGCK